MSRSVLTLARPVLVAALTCLLVGSSGVVATTAATTGGTAATTAVVAAKRNANPVTPGDFTGYGFDQCLTPTQAKMDAWLASSPFMAVGIYISGTSRACRDQPNLTPTWVATQLSKGWRLLPITLGPQASCQPRFPRYDDDRKIDPRPGKNGQYYWANQMGRAEADTTVADATALGIVPGSTLWYDLEGYDSSNKHCRESALRFLSGWTTRIHELGYVSGVYSSAGSGIRDLDNARVSRPGVFTLPDRIWVARWDGVANTSTSYLRADGWLPGGRVKQYQGGHDETWGGVKINIDRNYLDLGAGSRATAEKHCGSLRVSFPTYPTLKPSNAPKAHVKALQCLLREKGVLSGPITGTYGAATKKAARAWQTGHGFTGSNWWTTKNWMSLLSDGAPALLKHGSAGEAVRRLQRSLNAAHPKARLKVSGVFEATTERALKAYQSRMGQTVSGVATASTWQTIVAGKVKR
jgi:hypothetical protein